MLLVRILLDSGASRAVCVEKSGVAVTRIKRMQLYKRICQHNRSIANGSDELMLLFCSSKPCKCFDV